MNRERHLRQSMPVWLQLPGITEVVLVDWSTDHPFEDLLAMDSRVRIVRVLGETEWTLSYAYNLGIQLSRGEVVFKCDADCVPEASVLQKIPVAGRFFAGNWRSAPAGGQCVNGQCLFTRAQWRDVNGYSEVLRRYGHDDTDFYARLTARGHVRCEIESTLLQFAPHTDADRLARTPNHLNAVEAFIQRQPAFHESFNILVAAMLPWGPWFQRAHFEKVGDRDRLEVFRRDKSREIPLSDPLQQLARSRAIRALITRLFNVPTATANRLDEATCLAQIARYLSAGATNRRDPANLPATPVTG